MTKDQKKVLEELRANDPHPERGRIRLFETSFGDVYFERLTPSHLERWHNNGQLWMKSLMKDGEPDGLYEKWHKNGQLFCRGNYINGRIEGTFEEWYENGQLMLRCNYKKGLAEGLREVWHPNGRLGSRKTYKNGSREGLYESWFSTGNIAERANYKNGKLDGERVKWNLNGEIYERQIYRDNKIVLSLPLDGKQTNYQEVGPRQLTDTNNSKKNNDMNAIRDYKFACKGEQPVNGKLPIDLYLLGFGGYVSGSDLLNYDGLFDIVKDDLKEEIGDCSVEVSDDDVRALCDSVDEEAYKKDMNEVLMYAYIDCINGTYPDLVEVIEGEPVVLHHLSGFSSDEIHQKVLVDIAKLEKLHSACIADSDFFKALQKGNYELPFHLDSIDGRFLDDPDKPWDDLAILGPLEINNLLYINANLNNGLGMWCNNITEYCIDRAVGSDVQLQCYVDPDLMEQIASTYKNKKKKTINLPSFDKKNGKGRLI